MKPRNFASNAKEVAEEMDLLGDTTQCYNQYSKKYHDFLGMFDAVYIPRRGKTIGVNWTSIENVASRVKKIKSNLLFPAWIKRAGAEVWGFGLRKHRIVLLRRVRVGEG